jgi:hypothetical protein
MPNHAIVTPAPVSSHCSHKLKQSYSIAHDDFLSERVIIFHIDLEHSGQDARIVQLLEVAYDPSKDEYCGEFNDYIPSLPIMPSGKREQQKCMVESGQMKRESKNAGSIVDVWLWFVNFVESHLENGAKKGTFLGQGTQCNS